MERNSCSMWPIFSRAAMRCCSAGESCALSVSSSLFSSPLAATDTATDTDCPASVCTPCRNKLVTTKPKQKPNKQTDKTGLFFFVCPLPFESAVTSKQQCNNHLTRDNFCIFQIQINKFALTFALFAVWEFSQLVNCNICRNKYTCVHLFFFSLSLFY